VAAGGKHARGFGKDRGEVLDVFEDGVGGGEVDALGGDEGAGLEGRLAEGDRDAEAVSAVAGDGLPTVEGEGIGGDDGARAALGPGDDVPAAARALDEDGETEEPRGEVATGFEGEAAAGEDEVGAPAGE